MEAGEARNKAIAPISSDVPARLMANCLIIMDMIFSLDQSASENLVWIRPGQMAFTRILESPHSLAKTLVNEINAALETE